MIQIGTFEKWTLKHYEKEFGSLIKIKEVPVLHEEKTHIMFIGYFNKE